MADVSVNTSDILRHLAVRSSTKDSLLLAWKVSNGFAGYVQGYRVRYQAIGSAIVQDSPYLPSSTNLFDITHLHENTFYDVCLRVFTNVTLPADSCLTAATSTHSLSVALGSTFGAFLALGVVVMFVLLAKWQHYHRNRKLFQQHILSADSTESIEEDLCIVQENGDIELHCMELGEAPIEPGQVKDGSSPMSDFSADVIFHGASVCRGDPGAHGGSAGGEGSLSQRVLIGLDGHSCANSFILTSPSRDSRTGVSYSLLVPLSASGVLPFLMQQDHDQGHGQGQGRDESSLPVAGAVRSAGMKMKHQHPVVRLKLRKHPTIDYSSAAEEDWHSKAAQPHQPEVASHLVDQSHYQPMPYADGTHAQLNQHPINIGGDLEDPSGRQPTAVSNMSSDLLSSPTGGDTLPRSISNTW